MEEEGDEEEVGVSLGKPASDQVRPTLICHGNRLTVHVTFCS